ncbi:coil containing protein [Vibrio phage 1.191.O._10N.286.52.B4]|nr:coil containing protein [Vibrio phage 1.191.O._10N.286.52.B4]
MSNALVKIAENTGVTTEDVNSVLKKMIVSAKNQNGATASDAELLVLGGICAQYSLNPLVKEVHAFVTGGKLQFTIGVDGWLKIMNRHPKYNGLDREYDFDNNGKIRSVTTKIYTKGNDHPTPYRAFFSECFQAKSTAWSSFPIKMLTNKADIGAIRAAFGITDVSDLDPDEADRIKESEPAQSRDITPKTEAVNIEKIELEIAQAGDLDTLKSICGGIRKDLEARGLWEQHKSTIVKLNEEQKARIASFDDMEEAEFEEYQPEPEKQAAIDAELEDIAFEDDEEEF